MKWFTALVMTFFVALMLYASTALPENGDPDAPANEHVSPVYIEEGEHETHAPNIVTAVLADYRGYDTLGETVVIFTAGLACILILMKKKNDDTKRIP